MKKHLSPFLKSYWTALSLVLVGIAVVTIVVMSSKGPKHIHSGEKISNVSFIYAEHNNVVPRITGFGVIQPSLNFEALTEVSGRIIFVHQDLKNGALLDKGTLVAQLDATDYQLALKQAEANKIAAKSEIEELKIREQSLNKNLTLIEERLLIAERELKRKTQLSNKGSLSKSSVDSETQNVIALRSEKVNIEADLLVIPSSIAMATAQLESATANIDLQKRNIARTYFYLPFTGRVNQVNADKGQYVNSGKSLFSLDSIDKAEVSVEVPLQRMREFLVSITHSVSHSDPAAFSNSDTNFNAKVMQEFIETLGLKAKVHLNLSDNLFWLGRVISVGESVAPSTQTINVLVEIEHPYKNVKPGVQPPLLKGMHVSVTLAARDQLGVLLPRHALHEQGLYTIVNDKLTIANIEPELMMEDWLLFDPAEVPGGTQVITSDINSKIPQSKINGIHDSNLQSLTRDFSRFSNLIVEGE